MTSGIFKWSKTAGTNATADSSINWAEGMAPSAVNDSARAMMARVAEYRDDIAGAIVTSGTSTAYTVSSNEVFDSLADMSGMLIAFSPHTTNGATVTLAVDGLTAKPLRFGPSLDLQSGVLIQGTPYLALYNNSNGEFYLQGSFANAYGVPLGGMLPYIGSTAPNSAFVIPVGQAISRTTYSTLFTLVSTTYGTGDGSTTFNVPDLRGRAVFSPDSGGSGRITVAGGNIDGTVIGNTGGAQNETLTQAQLPSYNLSPSSITISSWTNIGSEPYIVTSNNGTINITSSGSTPVPDGTSTAPAASFTFGGSIPSGGSGSAHPILPPAIILPYILRVI